MTTQRRSRGRTGRQFSRAPKRAVQWKDRIVDLTLAAAAQNLFNLTSGIPDDQKKGRTIVRLLIDLKANLATAGTGGLLSMGIYLIEQDAFSAAAAADPDGDTVQPGWMWRWHGSVFSSVTNDAAQRTSLVFDIRARRKLMGEEIDLIMVTNWSAGASGPVNIDGLVRTLWMIP